jgi:hypothetical protein
MKLSFAAIMLLVSPLLALSQGVQQDEQNERSFAVEDDGCFPTIFNATLNPYVGKYSICGQEFVAYNPVNNNLMVMRSDAQSEPLEIAEAEM